LSEKSARIGLLLSDTDDIDAARLAADGSQEAMASRRPLVGAARSLGGNVSDTGLHNDLNEEKPSGYDEIRLPNVVPVS
jgi:hypothetical protein